MNKITEGTTTVDMNEFVASPAQAVANGLIDGGHIPREAVVRWLRSNADEYAHLGKGNALSSRDEDAANRATASAIRSLAFRIENGEIIS